VSFNYDEVVKLASAPLHWTHFLWFYVGLDVVGSLLLQFPLFSFSEDPVEIKFVDRSLVAWVG